MRFRVLTYNIHKAIGVDRRFAPERIVEVIRHHNPDLVLLQEVDRHALRSERLDLASVVGRALEYPYRAVSMNVHMKLGKYGNATLSRFPIGRQRHIDLTIAWRKRRGAQHTCVHIPNGSQVIDIDIFNVHLGLSAGERRVQMRRLMAAPDFAHVPDDRPVIVAGDMNDWRGVLRRACFDAAGFRCATNSKPGSKWSIRTFPSYAPTGGLDKVFYRGPLIALHAHRSRLKLARVASDHLPVIVDFEMRIEPTADREDTK